MPRESVETGQPSELDEFLPRGDRQATIELIHDTSRRDPNVAATTVVESPEKSTRVVIQSPRSDARKGSKTTKEQVDYFNGAVDQYEPFKTRVLASPTTDLETLTHLLKACLGSGILAMPLAFKEGGILFGIINTLITGLICGHCAYILVKSAHKLYYVARVPKMTYPELGEAAFAHGPSSLRTFAKPARISIIVGIFLTYFGTCCVYCVIVAGNLEQVYSYHRGGDMDKRWFIAALLPPLILLNYIPNLKILALLSQTANVLMAGTLSITLYYIFFVGESINSPLDLPQMPEFSRIPAFFSIVIFAMECIGVIMPLENNMKKPRHFVGTCGVLNIGMLVATIIYMLLGFVGYLKYGSKVEDVITLNLPLHEIPAQCAKLFIACAVLFTHPLQMFVCYDLIWNGNGLKQPSFLSDYIVRTILVTTSVIVAIVVPKISPFMTIIGALFFSALGLIFPVIIEMIVFWKEGVGFLGWKLFKNIFILIFGVLAMIFGTQIGVDGIVKANSPTMLALNATTPS